jgi:Acetyltransferase (GNAT) domain/Acetyltransferase (GNAT) family
MAATEALRTVSLSPAHAEDGLRLSAEADWNQTSLDWHLMLETGEGIGQLTADGELVASAVILPYGRRLAWIGMVLTSEAYGRRGLATANLHWAIRRCEELGLIAGLDATPTGREVYRPLGFADVFGLTRFKAEAPVAAAGAPEGVTLRPMLVDDLDRVASFDADAFGADRRHLVAYLRAAAPESGWIAERGSDLEGFVLGRPGRLARHLGPLCAAYVETAKALLARALGERREPVSIDVPDDRSAFAAWLEECRFARVRPFTRMLKDAGTIPGDPRRLFAIAGPELG